MERRGQSRSKSASRAQNQKEVVKSPRGRPRKVAEAPKREASKSRTRGRPPKTAAPTRERSRSASKSRSVSNRNRRTPRKKEESDDDQPLVVLNDIRRSGALKNNNLNDVIRRSLSRDIKSERLTDLEVKTRTSGRTTKKTESWTTEKISKTQDISPKVEFGGSVAAIITIIIFFLLIGSSLLGCTKEQCALQPFHIPRNWRVYLNVESAFFTVGFVFVQAVLSTLPIGRVVKSSVSAATYRANGFLALILTGAAVGGAWYLGYPVTLVYERMISCATSAYILAWLLSLGLFIKGGRAAVPGLNPYGNSGSKPYDFFVGREVNPVIFRLNIKVVLLRCCLIGSILIDCLLALKGYEVRKEWSLNLVTAVALKVIYALDALWFEESFTSTFEAQYEAVGLMTTQWFLLNPFFTAIIPRFILTHRVERSVYALATSVSAFLVGFFIYRASNLQKATFRKNPIDSAIIQLETLPTSRGKKLLVSGWWGIVKHPNYLGDIILTWAIASTIGFTHSVPYVVPLVITLILVSRAKRDDRRCQERYQAAWQEYSRRVPYFILPRVY